MHHYCTKEREMVFRNVKKILTAVVFANVNLSLLILSFISPPGRTDSSLTSDFFLLSIR